MPTTSTVAGRLLEQMAAAGAATVYGLPGVHNLAFWRAGRIGQDPEDGHDGAEDGLPRIVNVRHEQTAVYAADGFARASGRPGFALVTTGPGAANAAGAFGEAAASRSPVVLVASEVPRAVVEAGVRGALHQSSDQAGMFRPLAKAVFTPRTPDDAVADVAAAIRQAMTAPQGPVYVDVPADVLGAPAPAAPADRALAAPRVVPQDPAGLEQAAAVLAGAATVAVWAGGGVVQADAAAALALVAERLRAPVLTTFAGRGLLPPEHPCLVPLPPHEPEVEALLARAEALLVVGSELDGMNTKNLSLALPPAVVNVNVDPGRLAVPGRAVHGVAADAGWALAELARRLPGRGSGLADDVPRVVAGVWRRLGDDPRTADATRLVGIVQDLATARATVVVDMAIAGYWLAGYLAPARPRRLQYPMGWGTLGYALPASVGAAAGAAEPVLVVCGDGGAMFALGELATLAQEELPVTVLVVDDGGYGMLRFDQRHEAAPRGTDLRTPDFPALAAAFGIPAEDVEGVGDPLARALGRALSSGEPRLVRCRAALFPPRTTSPRWHET